MSIRTQLAMLFANKDMRMQEYTCLQEYKDLEKENQILENLSEYKLPEITKLICGSDILLKETWAKKYEKIAPLYRNVDKLDAFEIMVPYINSVSAFESDILLYADKQILLVVKRFFDDENRKLDQLRKDRDNLSKKVNSAKKKEQNTAQKSEKSKASESGAIISENSELVNVSLPVEKSEDEQKLDSIKLEIEKLSGQLKPWKKHIEKINEYYSMIESPDMELKREKAYKTIEIVKMPYEEEFLQEFIHTGVVPTDIENQFKDRMFCNRILQCLEKGSLKQYSIPIIAKLYEEGVIDLEENEFEYFVEHHETLLCEYLTEKVQQDLNFMENQELAAFFDIAFNSELKDDSQWSGSQFGALWNCFCEKQNWTWLIGKICDKHKDRVNHYLPRFIYLLSGKSVKVVNEFIHESNNPDIQISILDIYSELIDLDRGTNKELILGMMRLLEQNSNKKQRKLNTLERRLNSQGQEVFSATYMPIEHLEELAMNLKLSEGKIECNLVARQIIEIASTLRSGMETLNVFPIVDIDDWKYGRNIEFDPELHRMVTSGVPKSTRVKLKTIGFKYQNDEGEWKEISAEVYSENQSISSKQQRTTDNRKKGTGKTFKDESQKKEYNKNRQFNKQKYSGKQKKMGNKEHGV